MSEPAATRRFTPYERNQLLILGLIAGVLIGFFYLRWQQPLTPATSQQPVAEGPRVRVEVKGDVLKPGVYELAMGSTVDDLLKQSGRRPDLGEMPAAWRDMLIVDGTALEIWRGSDGLPHLSLNRMQAENLGLLFLSLELNEATAEDLESLPGIGPATARAIVAYRDEHGPFKRLEDLEAVPGVGEKTIESLRYRVVVNPRPRPRETP